jgi:hypothetical protein
MRPADVELFGPRELFKGALLFVPASPFERPKLCGGRGTSRPPCAAEAADTFVFGSAPVIRGALPVRELDPIG